MKVKELKEILKREFPIKEYKFKSCLGGAEFQFKDECKVCDIGVGIINRKGEYSLGWTAGIRFVNVEEIIEEGQRRDKKDRGIGSTLIKMDTSPDYMNGRISVPYEVKEEVDILCMLKKIEPFIYDKALPFFEQYKTIADLDVLLNNDPYEVINICSPVITIRSQKAIAAAWLNNNPNYEQLVQVYRKQQEGLAFNHEFENVVKLLETMER